MSRTALTPAQRAALPEILDLLGLQDAKLTDAERAGLCDLFHSMPHGDRRDSLQVAVHLILVQLGINAMSRAETMKTIKEGTNLQSLLKEVTQALQGLALGVEAA